MGSGMMRIESAREPRLGRTSAPPLRSTIQSAIEDVKRSFGPLAIVAGGITGAVALAAAIAVAGPYVALIAAANLALLVAVSVYPALGAFLLIATTPLIAGINRGGAIPLVRPNEGLLMIVAAALSIRFVYSVRARNATFRLSHLDLAMILLAITSSIMPLAWLKLRGLAIGHDDVLYSLMLWKYYAIFLIFRFAVRSVKQARICLWLSLLAASVVASLAILQSLGFGAVAHFLSTYYAPYGNVAAITDNRGGSTLGLPIAVADLLTFNIAIAGGMIALRSRSRRLLVAMSFLFIIGVFAAGEFSGVIGLALAVVVLAILTGRLSYLGWSLLPVLTAAVALRPVIERRLEGFQSPSGLPRSWEGRLHNLENYFWPQLFSGDSWILGVRPAARVASAKLATGYIWIESGYTWLLWAGGLPLLLSFFYFIWAGFRDGLQVLRLHHNEIGAAALALITSLSVVAVLMIIDPHITYRGSGDLIFALLGITAAGAVVPPTRRTR
jgi:hypothetical protein